MQRGELGGKDTPAWNGGGVGQVAKCQWACHWSREESRARWPGEAAAGTSLQGLGWTETCRRRVVCGAAGCAKKKLVVVGLAEGVEQPGEDEECHTEQESDTNAGVDGCSTNGN